MPLTGAPTTELRGVHAPFVSPVFFPMRLSTVNYYGALGGSGGTSLLVTPAQHRVADVALGTSTLRRYSGLDLRLFYSGNLTAAALSDAPRSSASMRSPQREGSTSPPRSSATRRRRSTRSGSPSRQELARGRRSISSSASHRCPRPAERDEESQLWKGRLTFAPADLQFVVQASNGLGLVSLDDNRGAFHRLAGAAAAATALTLVAPPVNGTFGETKTVTAALTGPEAHRSPARW